MRILLAGVASADGLGFTTGAVERALRRGGHTVERFDYRERRFLPGRRFDRLFTLVRRLESTPFLALEVGPSALAALRTMGDVVVRVIADAVLPPAGGSTPRR